MVAGEEREPGQNEVTMDSEGEFERSRLVPRWKKGEEHLGS